MSYKIVADDYGMNVEINQAISQLAKKNIISKVSVMANASVRYYVNDLGCNVKTGMHLNLLSNPESAGITCNKKNTSLLKMVYLIYTNQLSICQILDSINQQYNIIKSRGFEISYIDTHQHVHIVPKILKSVITFAKTKGIDSIRCITMERRYFIYYVYSLMRFGFIAQIPKMILLYAMGTLMKLKFDKLQINYCKNLILMPLAGRGDYEGLLKELLNKFKDSKAEVVVHPGIATGKVSCDKYYGRYIEYNSLLHLWD